MSGSMTALHQYAYEGDVEKLIMYMKRSYDINERDDDAGGKSPLHWATIQENAECVRLLLANGADPNVATYGGFTAVHYAAQSGNAVIMRIILDSGGDPTSTDKSGDAPMKVAERYGAKNCLELLSAAIKKPSTAVKKKRLEAASMASGAHCASGNDSVAYNSDDDLKPFAKLPGEAFVEPPSPEDKSAKRVLKSMIKREYAYGKPSSDKIKKDAAKRQPTAKK